MSMLDIVSEIRNPMEQVSLDHRGRIGTQEEIQMDEEICYGMVNRSWLIRDIDEVTNLRPRSVPMRSYSHLSPEKHQHPRQISCFAILTTIARLHRLELQ